MPGFPTRRQLAALADTTLAALADLGASMVGIPYPPPMDDPEEAAQRKARPDRVSGRA
ncbi:hypothetical protein IU500_31875 [Nocardia terpenica]|uniref:hypothetical protein n=1 Tax=Nocardia terpenica TaxID=455432 RepID=UPI0018943D97|nr:hypothetical protein [Nocardia terpenica]MBF6065579.1 hypothetical protein [Nocardia terpenica]MBF6108619.1 hypothetical protein [Nocardia terpenica]MBF6115649.1 hypothetical protein [Nocardia terpenica]MBF6122824.1 hypothetical protein [Nocardia terpenica]MBF6155824.1 hypothetical protein [Nocardia terpenica]